MKPKYVMGIDPGFTGAIGVYDPATFRIVAVYDMPLKEESQISKRPGPAKSKRYIDVDKLCTHILAYASQCSMCVLEQVSAAPDQGVTSMFRFGEGYGMIQGILATNGVRVLKTPPAVWKLAMNLTSEKATSISKIKRHIDSVTFNKYFPLKKDHGRAEAILLAMFGARSLGFELQNLGGDKSHELY